MDAYLANLAVRCRSAAETARVLRFRVLPLFAETRVAVGAALGRAER